MKAEQKSEVKNEMNAGLLITPPNTHQVFKALEHINDLLEKTGLKQSFKAETIAAPREITSQCGVAILCAAQDSPVWLGSSVWGSSLAQSHKKLNDLEQKNALLLEKIKEKELISSKAHLSSIYIIKINFKKREKNYVKTT